MASIFSSSSGISGDVAGSGRGTSLIRSERLLAAMFFSAYDRLFLSTSEGVVLVRGQSLVEIITCLLQ